MSSKLSPYLIALTITMVGCTSRQTTWPPGGYYSDKELGYVEFGAPIKVYCTGRYPEGLWITLLDSSDSRVIVGSLIRTSRSAIPETSDALGRVFLRLVSTDTLFVQYFGYQDRKFPTPRGCNDSVVAPLSARTTVIDW